MELQSARRDDLATLMTHSGAPCVSLLMPAHRAGPAIQQDPIRLKNLLRGAERRLLERGMRAREVGALLEPVRAVLEQSSFWRQQGDGLAVFLAPSLTRAYRLPVPVEERVMVNDRFHLKPLVWLLSGDGRFYLLALTLQGVRLFEGTRHTLGAIEVPGAPASVDEALKYDTPERQLQARTGPLTGEGTIVHGHTRGQEDLKKDIQQYFHRVDAAVTPVLGDDRAPLVLAGVDYLIPLYRNANRYAHLVDDAVTGHPDGPGRDDLHRQAWSLVEPIFRQAEEAAEGRYRELAGTGRTLTDLAATLAASRDGRVESLFVSREEVWGHFDPASGRVEIHPHPERGDYDLLDVAATQTLVTRGAVYLKAPGAVPGGGPVAAVLRY
jgi:hypothetical protein